MDEKRVKIKYRLRGGSELFDCKRAYEQPSITDKRARGSLQTKEIAATCVVGLACIWCRRGVPHSPARPRAAR
jgi:hypothetical protein